MAELIVIPVLIAAQRVIRSLKELESKKKYNTTIAREIEQFISSLDENIDLLKEELPKKDGSWALESLTEDLDKAADYLDEGLKNGNFEKFWDAKQIKDKLERLRQDLINKFQVKLFITTLEVVIEADGKMENFGSRMLELSSLSAARSHAATDEIRKLLQPLVVGMRRQDQRIQSFVSMVRGNEVKVETSTETQKFLADVLANLEYLTDEDSSARPTVREDDRDDYLDPNTKDLMIDPVKCKDGRTYDRFAVFQYNLTQKQPLVIACDDLDVRARVFEKFANEDVENKFRRMRKSYRDEALALANKGNIAEGLSMIKNVLEWAPHDYECLEMRDRLEYQMAKRNQAPSAPDIHHMETPPTQVIQAPQQQYAQQQYGQQQYGQQKYGQQQYGQQPNWQQQSTKDVESLVVRLVILIFCFPCSLCCLPCLFPEMCGDSDQGSDQRR